MKVKTYLKQLQELVKANPEFLEYECIYTSDDEGNHVDIAQGPCLVHWQPSEHMFESAEDGIPAICVN